MQADFTIRNATKVGFEGFLQKRCLSAIGWVVTLILLSYNEFNFFKGASQ